ncbi:MAG: shikimate dehydrogenase [Bacteroidales bacterium]|nr:shikimate dehydrogenase [Bacteroidales bacterium]
MTLYGLIGYPIDHSWSAVYFAEKFRLEGITDQEYRLFPLQNLNQFSSLLEKNPDLLGLNVTIPHKVNILPLLDELDNTAKTVGAVNTIKIIRSHERIRTKGFNTDTSGFLLSLPENLPDSKVLLLGTGGASKAVAYVLHQKKMEVIWVSRNPNDEKAIRYSDVTAEMVYQCRVIINATPVGMYPHIMEIPPIPYTSITPQHLLYDLIYNPEETRFLAEGRKRGARIMNGKQMLMHQAESAYRIFIDPEN